MVKIKKKEVSGIVDGLSSLTNKEMKAKVAYDVRKDSKILKEELGLIQEIYKNLQLPKDFIEFEEKRKSILEDLAKKDQNGRPIRKIDANLKMEVFDLPDENIELAKERLAKLQKEEKYSKAILEREKLENDFNEMMEEEIEIDLRLLDVNLLPDLTPSVIEALDPILSE